MQRESWGYHPKIVADGVDFIHLCVRLAEISLRDHPRIPEELLRLLLRCRGTVRFSQDFIHNLHDWMNDRHLSGKITGNTVRQYACWNVFLSDVVVDAHSAEHFTIEVNTPMHTDHRWLHYRGSTSWNQAPATRREWMRRRSQFWRRAAVPISLLPAAWVEDTGYEPLPGDLMDQALALGVPNE